MKRRAYRAAATALFCVAAARALLACTDGTTPDCKNPNAHCAPDLDGSLPEAGDAAADDAEDANEDAGDDALPDGAADGALDADANG
jgi:hypothetical protein